MSKELREADVVEYIENRLTEFGFIKGERKCYTPKHGEGAYVIEDWTAETVGIFLAGDILKLFDRYAAERERERVEAILKKWQEFPDDGEFTNYLGDEISKLKRQKAALKETTNE